MGMLDDEYQSREAERQAAARKASAAHALRLRELDLWLPQVAELIYDFTQRAGGKPASSEFERWLVRTMWSIAIADETSTSEWAIGTWSVRVPIHPERDQILEALRIEGTKVVEGDTYKLYPPQTIAGFLADALLR